MNPVLLKATGEAGCQVILNGRVHANMRAENTMRTRNMHGPR